ncbi:uncharacterized protein [Euphorbia lathyris]|uniref:uncharacterized protein n=1 Tax=Euphorbia lathyris TaxID=212925 RepID=UPI00331384DF
MSGDTEASHVTCVTDALHVAASTPDVQITVGDDDDMLLFRQVVRSLPSHAVKDLLSAGVCMRCIFRLLGIQGQVYFGSPLSASVMHALLRDLTDPDEHIENSKLLEAEPEPGVCNICLGILQFIYCDDNGMMVKKQSATNLALSITEHIKQEGRQIDGFSLEVSIPPLIQENEQIVCSYMKKKYRTELWFQERLSKCLSTKDALKLAIVDPLEKLLVVKSGPSSCRIRLTYTQAKPSCNASSVERGESCKRRKTGTDVDLESINDQLVNASDEKNNVSNAESLSRTEDNEHSGFCIFPKDKVNVPCHLVFSCYRTPIYFGGRYMKFSRNVSQTRWIIDDERMGEASIEEIIGGNILPICHGDSYKFHAAGREDIDVRMLGSGRPFLVEVQNARQVPTETLVKEIEKKINSLDNKLVGVKNLKMVSDQGWALMQEGEAEKQKQYCALVWISRPLVDEDVESIASLEEIKVLQRTPVRVLHRRSPLDREKIIHWMKIERITGSCQYFLLHLCTQAGTYIKEFVHGDLGRTQPSIGSILGCRAEILQLDVTDVKMDCFLAE